METLTQKEILNILKKHCINIIILDKSIYLIDDEISVSFKSINTLNKIKNFLGY